MYPEFPPAWQRPTDLVDAFLLTSALEVLERRLIDPAQPYGSHVFPHLSSRFKYDPFRSLLTFGSGHSPFGGERYGRLPLLALVWQLVDETIARFKHLRSPDPFDGIATLIDKHLAGTILDTYGTTLFMAALERRWFETVSGPRPHHFDPRGTDNVGQFFQSLSWARADAGPPGASALTEIEESFIAGTPIQVPRALVTSDLFGKQVLNPNGGIYMDSIWRVAWRLVELKSPGHYINQVENDKRRNVERILDAAGARGLAGEKPLWPGWLV